jgi:hypothetical protein
MRVTMPGVAIGAIIAAYVVLGLDMAGALHLRQPPAEQNTKAVQSPQAGGPRQAPQSAAIVEQTGGGRQTNPATALRQSEQQKAPEAGAKVPEQGPVRSQTGLEPSGAPQAAGLPPNRATPPQSAATAPAPAPTRQ